VRWLFDWFVLVVYVLLGLPLAEGDSIDSVRGGIIHEKATV
jgi:hypothetical protein